MTMHMNDADKLVIGLTAQKVGIDLGQIGRIKPRAEGVGRHRSGKKMVEMLLEADAPNRAAIIAIPDSGARDVLMQLAQAPRWDGDLNSKDGRDRLVAEGWASRWNGINFLTQAGWAVVGTLYGLGTYVKESRQQIPNFRIMGGSMIVLEGKDFTDVELPDLRREVTFVTPTAEVEGGANVRFRWSHNGETGFGSMSMAEFQRKNVEG